MKVSLKSIAAFTSVVLLTSTVALAAESKLDALAPPTSCFEAVMLRGIVLKIAIPGLQKKMAENGMKSGDNPEVDKVMSDFEEAGKKLDAYVVGHKCEVK
jgi:hypothetical protein